MANLSEFIAAARQREPQLEEIGIGGFVLLARVRNSTTLTARAPTTPLEDGSFASDHIVNEPMELIIEGEVSNIHVRPSPQLALQRRLSSEIANISVYAPPRTQAQLSRVEALINDASDAVRAIDDLIDSGRQALEFFGNKDTDSKGLIEQFIDYVESLHYGKQLFSISMPFRVHDNMVMTSVEMDEDNMNDNLGFTLRAQKIRFVETEVADVSEFFPNASSNLNGQQEGESDKGAQAGEEVPRSFLSTVFD